jgi:hypothetical protein
MSLQGREFLTLRPSPAGKVRRNKTIRAEGRIREGEEANARAGTRKGKVGQPQAQDDRQLCPRFSTYQRQ